MSAFLVEDKTINIILSGFEAARNDRGGKYGYLGKNLKAAMAEPEILGERLQAMNEDALKARYGDEPAGGFEYVYFLIPNRYQLLKSLRCFLYQCSEGDVPNTQLFKDVEEFAGNLALAIIEDSPEYEKANWG